MSTIPLPLSNLIYADSTTALPVPKNLNECTFYISRFLSARLPTLGESLIEIMHASYWGKSEDEVKDILLHYGEFFSIYRNIPYMIDKDGLDYFGQRHEHADNEFITLEKDKGAYRHYLDFVRDSHLAKGALIANGVLAIGMKSHEDGSFEFFDPLGFSSELTNHKKGPYFKLCRHSGEASEFLQLRFSSLPEGGELSAPLKSWLLHLI